jgi:hypothetical protein
MPSAGLLQRELPMRMPRRNRRSTRSGAALSLVHSQNATHPLPSTIHPDIPVIAHDRRRIDDSAAGRSFALCNSGGRVRPGRLVRLVANGTTHRT